MFEDLKAVVYDFRESRSGEHARAFIKRGQGAWQGKLVCDDYAGWGAELEDSFRCIVFLHVDTDVRLERIRARKMHRFGRVDPAFLEWAAQYETGPPEGVGIATAVAATLLGTAPAMASTVADRAEQMREVVAILRATPSAAAQHVAEAFETWLDKGGDLRQRLGIKVKRGGARDVPSTRLLRQRRDKALRELATKLPGKPTARANALAAMLRDRDPETLVLHQTVPAVPTSPSQLLRIIKGA